MAVKNLTMFGSFDSGISGWYQQAEVFPQAVAQTLADMVGVSGITGRSLGKIRVRGGSDSVAKAKINWPSTGDNELDVVRGGRIACATVTDLFLELLRAKLLEITGASLTALIVAASSQENAILNTPPGLVVTAPETGVAIALSTSDGFNFSLTAGAEIADEATASAILTISPSAGSTANMTSVLRRPNADYRLNWKFEDVFTIPVAGGGTKLLTRTAIMDGEVAALVNPTFDGTEITTNPQTVGDFVVRSYAYKLFTFQNLTTHEFLNDTSASFLIGDEEEGGNTVIVSGANVNPSADLYQKVSTITFTNKTGSAIAAGAEIATMTFNRISAEFE